MNCAQVVGADLGRPVRQRLAFQPPRQRALPEGTVDDDRHAALGRQRQQPLLRLAIDDVVGELHEIERMVPHDLLEQIVPAAFGGGDADIAELPVRLHGEQRLEMRLPCDEIVDLHEIEARHAPEAPRLLDLRWSVRGRRGPDLVGRKQALGPAELFEPVADDRLRGAVHWRGIDHATARLEEGRDHVGAFVA